ncbi:permease [Lutibaculum baratangense]|uniref:Putative permease n=1 Tax=Lutibaculum baratangense AMV1 TaxID=631454 RepID=V4RGY2_9HYPH|nr:permease [Lutibaculum baratangense]ESR22550.1 putative permease [Lutibaculum baratangense AMV1]
MLVWLSIAFVGEFLLRRYVPEELVASLVGGDNPWAVPLAATVGAPIYLDGYAALPLIRGLVDSGMRPDAALAFLIAGGITSAWAAIPVYALVRTPTFVLYLLLAVGGSMLAGRMAGVVL